MKSNELRVNNWVTYGDGYLQVDINSIRQYIRFEPIPLTTEILEKVILDGEYYLDKGNLYKMVGVCNAVWLCSVEYLHHLQNIIHALTGTELNINL